MLRRMPVLLLTAVLAACAGEVDESLVTTSSTQAESLRYCPEYEDCQLEFCGNGICSVGESNWSCPEDCSGSGFCGDGYCDYNEDPWNCSLDCGGYCGDGLCGNGEDSWSCPGDCGAPTQCGDGICNNGETPASCSADCGSSPGTVLGRFSHWCGKVNSHTSPTGVWTPDADCTSGCNLGGVAYCQKYWSNSTVIRQVSVSSKPPSAWVTAGCGPVYEEWDGDAEFECVDDRVYCGDGVCNGAETSANCPSDCVTVLGRISRWCGKVNLHQSPGGNWATDSDCTSGCNLGGVAYCQKFWPGASGIRQVSVSSKADNVWTTAGCGPVFEPWDGDDEFECLD